VTPDLELVLLAERYAVVHGHQNPRQPAAYASGSRRRTIISNPYPYPFALPFPLGHSNSDISLPIFLALL